MDLGLDDKIAWVLGASSGLGRATAAALAREGATVAVSARDPQRLAAAADDIGGYPYPLDVTDAAGIAATGTAIATELGPIDILVANAGGPPPGRIDQIDEETFYRAFELTTASAWRLVKAVLPGMQERGRGVLVFVTSWGTKEVIPPLLLSNTMRAAVVGFAKTLSKQLGSDGIRALCVAPGRFDTDRLRELDELAAASSGRTVEEVVAASHAQIPAGRYGRPSEFGDVVAFLASERASYINGITVTVDGGMIGSLLA